MDIKVNRNAAVRYERRSNKGVKMDIKVKLICKKCGDELESSKSISMCSADNETSTIELLITPCECCLTNARKQGRKDNEPVYALKGQQAKYIGDSVNMLGMIPGSTYEISRAKKHDGILIISLTGFGHAEFNSKYFEINSVLSEKHMKELFSENDVTFR